MMQKVKKKKKKPLDDSDTAGGHDFHLFGLWS